MLRCLGMFMTSIGINCEQNGITLRVAPTDLYSSNTFGKTTPLRLQAYKTQN